MTTLPVVDLDAALSRDARTVAQFTTGSGWTTQILLVNPTDQVLSGILRFIDDSGRAGPPVAYSVSVRSSYTVRADSVSGAVQKGSVSVILAFALPDNWNGRFLFQGGGGLNGTNSWPSPTNCD